MARDLELSECRRAQVICHVTSACISFATCARAQTEANIKVSTYQTCFNVSLKSNPPQHQDLPYVILWLGRISCIVNMVPWSLPLDEKREEYLRSLTPACINVDTSIYRSRLIHVTIHLVWGLFIWIMYILKTKNFLVASSSSYVYFEISVPLRLSHLKPINSLQKAKYLKAILIYLYRYELKRVM